ncbi:MAG: hypothetical protein KDE48_12365 [Anaerolineales bacterium]|nr:hypothetical protein [Anaerolineales bacterium]
MRTSNNLGRIIVTSRAQAAIKAYHLDRSRLLRQHAGGLWGQPDNKTVQDTEFVTSSVLTSYSMPSGELWIKTEFDPQVTTILLPEEH